MPPRFAYWTIIVDGKPTAFRAQLREELEPTFKQLHNKHPDAVMMWFARGRLWASPEEAHAAERRGREDGERRNRDWRPGGEHKDPRARFDVPRDEKRRRFAEKLRRESGRPFEGPPRGESRGEGEPARPPRAESRGEGPPRDRPTRDEFKPRGDRPPGRPEWQRGHDRPKGKGHERPQGRSEWKPGADRRDQRKPWTPRPDQDRGARPPRPEGERPQGRPDWKRDRPDERGPSGRSDRDRGPRPRREGERVDRPWRPAKPGWKPKPPGDRGPGGDRDSRRPPSGGGQRPPGKGPGGFRPKGEGGFAPKGKGGFRPKGPGGFGGRPDNRNRGGGARGPGGRPPGNRGPRGGGGHGGGNRGGGGRGGPR